MPEQIEVVDSTSKQASIDPSPSQITSTFLPVRLGRAAIAEGALVFPSQRLGQPMDAAGVSRRLHRALAAVGLPRIRFHDLRHTTATLLLGEGRSPREMMELLGHSQISLTMNTYAHVLEAAKVQAAAAMDAVLTRRADPA